MRLATAAAMTLALTVPHKAEARKDCGRKCMARVAHKACSNTNPRQCVWHAIYHGHIRGWRRAWLLRVPGCESGWNPLAQNRSGASGLFQFMPGTWATTPYGRRSIWSARWQSFAAVYMLRAGRSGEWVCG